ncbi:MAG TPA: 2-amino-4-hydroxy-6-hydroxymethyldihydropteridine diphosphokinase [Longimicrobiales bacterium]|nr:2-amino-4-hydroxy-6-hydroxymethyldihydropteridine diphosphokinase [Longimicrobiales bacterium]
MPEAFIGLGSNLGDPAGNLRDAVARIARVAEVVALSSAYRTEPVGLREQPFFLNAVARVRTELGPRELLAELAAIEDALGRQRTLPSGPRTIDLDLLLHGEAEADEPGLRLPHPRMLGRRFVLAPLAELAPAARIGPGGPTAAEALAALPEGPSVERVVLPGWPPERVPEARR